VKNWQYFPTQNVSLNSAKEWLSYDIVRFKIELGLKRNSSAKRNKTDATWQYARARIALAKSSHYIRQVNAVNGGDTVMLAVRL